MHVAETLDTESKIAPPCISPHRRSQPLVALFNTTNIHSPTKPVITTHPEHHYSCLQHRGTLPTPVLTPPRRYKNTPLSTNYLHVYCVNNVTTQPPPLEPEHQLSSQFEAPLSSSPNTTASVERAIPQPSLPSILHHHGMR